MVVLWCEGFYVEKNCTYIDARNSRWYSCKSGLVQTNRVFRSVRGQRESSVVMKKIIIRVVIIAVIILAAGMMVFAAGRPRKMRGEAVKRGSITGVVKDSGDIHGEKEKIYYASVTSPLSKVSVKQGDSVKAGDMIVAYDASDLARSVSAAEIATMQARENYEGKLNKSNKYESKFNKAVEDDAAYAGLYWIYREKDDEITEGQYAENYQIQCEIDSLKKQIDEKKKQISEKTGDLNDETDYGLKDTDDYDEDDIDDIKDLNEEIDDLNTEIAGLQAQLDGAPQQKMTPEENEEKNDTLNVMEDITRNWEQAKTDKANYESGILDDKEKKALSRDADRLRLQQDMAEEDLAKAYAGVTADFDGVITHMEIQEGAEAEEGTELFTLESTDEMKCTAMISRYDIGAVRVGQKAEVDVAGKIYEGQVEKVGRLAENDETDQAQIPVDIKILEPDEALAIGTEADVTIFTDETADTLLIPADALYTDDSGDYCYTTEDGKITKVRVSTGVKNDDFVEITDGLSEDQMVLTDAVTDGDIGKKAEIDAE